MLLIVVYLRGFRAPPLAAAGGPVGVQPSELAKPALVVFLAFFVTWRGAAINNTRHTLLPAALAVGLVIFAVVVADLGTAVVLGAAAAMVFFVAGLEWRYVRDRGGGGARSGVVLFIARSPTGWRAWCGSSIRSSRSSTRFDPRARIKAQHGEIAGHARYQLSAGAIEDRGGRRRTVGGWADEGRQKLLYLPEAHTDFIYAVVGEELGLVGTVGAAGRLSW